MNNNHDCRETPDIGIYILEYLIEHPRAEDTLTGIVDWWLLHQTIKHEITRVINTINELVHKGLIVEVRGPDYKTFYRINPGSVEEVKAILRRSLRD